MMSLNKRSVLLAGLLLSVSFTSVLSSKVSAAADDKKVDSVVKADGSSTVYPITEAVAEEFQAKEKIKVTVATSGTGGGFKKFCKGETDVQDASRPITKAEMEVCSAAGIKYIELPVAYDAIVIAVNPKNTWLSEISLPELKEMWKPEAQGKVKNWNQLNPKYPNQDLKLYGAGSDSGTFDYFTEAVVGKAKSSRGDYTASEDDNTLVQGIINDKGALGFIPLTYYVENKAKLKALHVVSPATKKATEPTVENVKSGVYAPLSRPLFIYIAVASLKKAEVKKFVEFYLKNVESLSAQVKAIPLPVGAYKLAADRFSKGIEGTVFSGQSDIGVTVEQLLKKETKL